MIDKKEDHQIADGVVLFRLDSIDKTMRNLVAQVSRLVLIEERQSKTAESMDRAFDALKEHDHRIRNLELTVPITDRTNIWVERALIAIASGVGAVVLKLILTP